MRSTREIYDPGIIFHREARRQYRTDKRNNRLIYRGLVTFVDRIGNDVRPAFSLRAKVFGIDDPYSSDNENFYPPLFPANMIAIPEVGEEILIICEEVGNLHSGFWISRASNNNQLTKLSVGNDDSDSTTIHDKFGTGLQDELPKEETDINPDEKYDIPERRFKPGDVPVQGRSNTTIVHSFDSATKKGYIEILTEGQSVSDSDFFSKDFQQSKGSRIIVSTLSNLDDLIANNIGKNFSATFNGIRNQNSAYLLLESLNLRFISRDGGDVQSAVLGEDQEIWLKALTAQIVKLTDQVDKLKSAHDSHDHPAGTLLDSTGKPCTSKTASTTKSGVDVSKIKSDVSDLDVKIKEHHSQHVALN